jgi:hypothetical protein
VVQLELEMVKQQTFGVLLVLQVHMVAVEAEAQTMVLAKQVRHSVLVVVHAVQLVRRKQTHALVLLADTLPALLQILVHLSVMLLVVVLVELAAVVELVAELVDKVTLKL